MIEKTRTFLFFIFLTAIIIGEVWGGIIDRKILLYFYLFFPSFLLFTHSIDRKSIKIPVKITFAFISFHIFVAFSTLFAIDKQVAFEHQLLYLSLYILFLFLFNNALIIRKIFPVYLIVISFITIVYSFFLQFIARSWFPHLLPDHTYQLVYKYPGYLNHYPLGAFALLSWGLLFVQLIHRKSRAVLIGFIFISILIIMSSLRSAYVSILLVLGIVVVYWRRGISDKLSKFLLPVLIIFFLALFITTKTSIHIPFISDIHIFLTEKGAPFENKNLFDIRINYIEQGVQAIKTHPIIGYGSFNFKYISLRYTESLDHITNTSHILFIDILAENGVFTTVAFFCGILLFLRSVHYSFQNKNFDTLPFAVCFLLLFFFFQLNFYSRFYFFQAFMYAFAALFYQEKEVITSKKLVLFTSVILIGISIILISSKIAYVNGNDKLAIQIYVLNDEAHKRRIQTLSTQNQHEELEIFLSRYIAINSDNPMSLSFVGSIYLEKKEYMKALQHLSKALELAPHEPDIIINTYYAVKHTYSQEKASEMLLKHIATYSVFEAYSTELIPLKDLCGREKIPCGI